MNSKGVFCFLLVLAFLAAELDFLNRSAEASKSLGQAKAIAFEAEKASLVRTLMENSVDSTIEESLKQGLVSGLEPEEIKRHVNAWLARLFRKMENAYSEDMQVKFGQKSLEEGFLNENSAVLVTRLGRKTIEAEYSFTGGVMKNRQVSAEIAGSKSKQAFKIPAGYTARAKVIG